MEKNEITKDDARKLTLVVVFMSVFVVVLFGVVPLV